MGSFMNQLFTLMLGWLQGLGSMLWNAFTAPGEQGLLAWAGKYWIPLAIGLCLAGALADLGVYLVRWRPMDVWKSFLRRRRHGNAEQGMDARMTSEAPEEGPDPETAGPSGRVNLPGKDEGQAGLYRREAEERSRRMAALAEEEQAALNHREEAERSLRTSRRRRRFSGELFTEGREGGITAPQDLFNAEHTYHQPVYPRKWKTNGEQHESADD
jgi:hypothetical protein